MFNEIGYSSTQLGYLGDPVSAGDTLHWSANVAGLSVTTGTFDGGSWISGSWLDTWNKFLSLLQGEGFGILKASQNEDARNLAANVRAPIGFADIGDANGLISGIANQAGFQLSGTNIQAGGRPIESPTASPWSNPLGTAATFWGNEAGNVVDSFKKGLGVESLLPDVNTTTWLVVGAVVLGAVFFMRR